MGNSIRINQTFKTLIRPLSTDEYAQLEENLMRDGCIDPIILWNGFIIDGHNRYEICTKYSIPFTTREMDFESTEEAITWICANQLGRRNISEETRKYLIGKRYEAEKIIGIRKCNRGINQYSIDPDDESAEAASVRYRTAQRLGNEYHCSHNTVKKYGRYSRALDRIGQKEPDIVPGILSGQIKVSHDNIMSMSEMGGTELRRVRRMIEDQGEGFVPYSETRSGLKFLEKKNPPQPAIKEMPVYDPDSEVTGLILTIPSWASSIERVKSKADINAISAQALQSLQSALSSLQKNITEMLDTIKEAHDDE